VEGIGIKNKDGSSGRTLSVQGVFILVGTLPNTEWLKPMVPLDPQGFIQTDAHMATPIPGIFAAGDVRQKLLRQISTAVGDGATAVFAAERYLEAL